MAVLASYDPITGDLVGEFAIADRAAVDAAVARARAASTWWRDLGFRGRAVRLRDYAGLLAGRLDELAALIRAETGKPLDDARLEVVVTIAHLRWAAGHAERVLRRRSVAPGLLMANVAASVGYQPYGVVGVIGPWNYPVFTPMGSIGYALAAGNAVVAKPSEHTPATGQWLADAFAGLVPEFPVLQVIHGSTDTGAALVGAAVDKLAFTGSTGTGRKVMAACARSLTPVVIECGGKDPLVVAADADVDAAVEGALWGGFTNAGQTCVGVERVYAVAAVYDEFVGKLAARARALRPGAGEDASYGPMTVPAQADIVRRQVDDALARGAKDLLGGDDTSRPPYLAPRILTRVPADAPAETEETFGPMLTVARVADLDEAVARANAGRYGLGATVYSRRHGEAIARRMRAGMVSVNSVIAFVAVPALPFGGVGDSGFGRVHGADGLREFARPQAISRERVTSPLPVLTFRRAEHAVDRLVAAVRAAYGRR